MALTEARSDRSPPLGTPGNARSEPTPSLLWSHLGVAAVVSTLVLLPWLFLPTLPHGPDAAMHIFNASQYAQEVSDGVMYPRWLDGWYGGFGAPIGIFYPPLTNLFSSHTAVISGISVVWTLKLVVWLSSFLSWIFMYKWSSLSMSSLGAVIASTFYVVAPYRVFDFHGRVAIPETVAFVWLPLVMYLSLRVVQSSAPWRVACLGMAMAGLVLTHILIAYLSILVFAPLILVMVCVWKGRTLEKLIGVLLSSLLALLLSAVYWIPGVFEREYINKDWMGDQAGWGDFHNNFIFRASSYAGTEWHNVFLENIEIGLCALLYIFVWIVSIVFIGQRVRRFGWARMAIQMMMAWACVAGVMMSSHLLTAVWEILPGATTIVFPWRFLTLSSFGAAYLLGEVSSCVWSQRQATLGNHGDRVLAFFIVVLFAGSVAYSCAIIVVNRQGIAEKDIAQLLGEEPLSPQQYDWVYDMPYIPIWAAEFDFSAPAVVAASPVDAGLQGEFDVERDAASAREYSIVMERASHVRVKTFWYPGWTANVGGEVLTDQLRQPDGTIGVDLPAGETNLTLTFENTALRSLGTAATGLGLSIVGFVALAYLVPRRFRVARL